MLQHRALIVRCVRGSCFSPAPSHFWRTCPLSQTSATESRHEPRIAPLLRSRVTFPSRCKIACGDISVIMTADCSKGLMNTPSEPARREAVAPFILKSQIHVVSGRFLQRLLESIAIALNLDFWKQDVRSRLASKICWKTVLWFAALSCTPHAASPAPYIQKRLNACCTVRSHVTTEKRHAASQSRKFEKPDAGLLTF